MKPSSQAKMMNRRFPWEDPRRKILASQIDEIIQAANVLTQRNGTEMEEYIFEKSHTREEYYIFITILMKKIRDCGIRLDSDLAGPSYADIEQPVVDPLSELIELVQRGPSKSELHERRRFWELDPSSQIPLPSVRTGSILSPDGRSAQSEKYKGDYSWRTPAFRKSIIAKLDEVTYKHGRPTSKDSMEMEQLLFEKAKSREEYTTFVDRVLLHIKETDPRNMNKDKSSVSDISDLIPDPLGAYLERKGQPRSRHYPAYCYSGLRGTPKKLLGGG